MKVGVAVLGFPSQIVPTVSVDVKTLNLEHHTLCSELRRWVKVEVGALGSPSLTVWRVFVYVKQRVNERMASPQS